MYTIPRNMGCSSPAADVDYAVCDWPGPCLHWARRTPSGQAEGPVARRGPVHWPGRQFARGTGLRSMEPMTIGSNALHRFGSGMMSLRVLKITGVILRLDGCRDSLPQLPNSRNMCILSRGSTRGCVDWECTGDGVYSLGKVAVRSLESGILQITYPSIYPTPSISSVIANLSFLTRAQTPHSPSVTPYLVSCCLPSSSTHFLTTSIEPPCPTERPSH